MKSPQFWVVLLCLLATLVVIRARGDVDQAPPSTPLAQMPATLGQYSSQEIPITSESLAILGKGDFLNRLYTLAGASTGKTNASAAPVQLFVAYFPTQRSGQSIHSPQNCLPGSGWTFQSSGVTTFTDRTGKAYQVGDYVIFDGREKQEVLYWYQSHGRSIASDYRAKLLMLTDAIRYGRTDAALVRIITAVSSNESPEAAHERVIRFAKDVTPLFRRTYPTKGELQENLRVEV